MEITLATQENKKALSALWQECFGDEESTIALFFKHSFNPQNTVICKDGEKLVPCFSCCRSNFIFEKIFIKRIMSMLQQPPPHIVNVELWEKCWPLQKDFAYKEISRFCF